MICTHGLVFNYADGKSKCGECDAEFITTAQGQRLSIDALEDMYEALVGAKAIIASLPGESATFNEIHKAMLSAEW